MSVSQSPLLALYNISRSRSINFKMIDLAKAKQSEQRTTLLTAQIILHCDHTIIL